MGKPNSSCEKSNNNGLNVTPSIEESENHKRTFSPKSQMRDNTNPNFSFALDFSPKREINKVTFASFQPDNDDHILETYCDNNDDCDNIDSFNEEEDEEEITFRSQDNLINTNENCFNKFPSK